MSRTQEDYLSQATEEVINYLETRIEEIVATLLDKGEVHGDEPNINDLAGEFHCDLRQAVQVLEDLNEYEEDDDSLWKGANPKDALIIMAHHTYLNAASQLFRNTLRMVSEDETVQNLLNDIDYVKTWNDPDELRRIGDDNPEENQEKLLKRLKYLLSRRVETVLKESG